MTTKFKFRLAQRGSSLIEVLVTLVILLLGLLGLVALMVQSQRSQMESYQRVQALVVLQDMVNRINTNRKAVECYAIAMATGDAPLGTGYTGTPTCAPAVSADPTSQQQAQAGLDLLAWSSLLTGSAEKLGTSDVGAMLGARGCITVTQVAKAVPVCFKVPVAPLDPNRIYDVLVSVVWQGNGKTVAPSAAITCGKDLYGDDALRRAVSASIQISTHIGSDPCSTQP